MIEYQAGGVRKPPVRLVGSPAPPLVRAVPSVWARFENQRSRAEGPSQNLILATANGYWARLAALVRSPAIRRRARSGAFCPHTASPGPHPSARLRGCLRCGLAAARSTSPTERAIG